MSVAISPEKELGKTKSPGGFLGVHHLTPLTIVEQGFWGNPGTVGARSLRGIWPSGMILGEEVDVSSASLPSAPGLLMPRNGCVSSLLFSMLGKLFLSPLPFSGKVNYRTERLSCLSLVFFEQKSCDWRIIRLKVDCY